MEKRKVRTRLQTFLRVFALFLGVWFASHAFCQTPVPIRNLALAAYPSPFGFGFTTSGNVLAFFVSEEFQGESDLNDDGDAEDVVLHVHDCSDRGNVPVPVEVELKEAAP